MKRGHFAVAIVLWLTCHSALGVMDGEIPAEITQDSKLKPLFDKCFDLDAPQPQSEAACRDMLRLTEHLPEGDIRYRAAIEGLSIRSSNIEERYRLTVRSLELLEKHDGGNHRAILSNRFALGTLKSEMGYWDDAFEKCEDAVAYGKKYLGKNDLELAAVRLLLGIYYFNRGKLQEAKIHLHASHKGAIQTGSQYASPRLNVAYQSARLLADLYKHRKLNTEEKQYRKVAQDLLEKLKKNE